MLLFAAIVLPAGACSPGRSGEPSGDGTIGAEVGTAGAERVACAHEGDESLGACTVDRAITDQEVTLTLRHPDGAFRRLVVKADGRGVAAADGAEPAHVTMLDAGTMEVAIGGDRYRLPATVRGQAVRP